MAIKELSNVQIKSGSDWYKLCPFPVGYIYMGYTSTSPATTYGGTWSSISGGRYFRAAAANDANGSNTIKIENMPSHSHKLQEGSQEKYTGWTGPGGDRLMYGQMAAGRTIWEFIKQDTTSVGGGQGFLSNISKRICLETYRLKSIRSEVVLQPKEKNSLTSISWMEVSDNGNNTR